MGLLIKKTCIGRDPKATDFLTYRILGQTKSASGSFKTVVTPSFTENNF